MMIECNLMSMREWNYFLRILTGGVEGWNRIGDYCWGLPPPDPRVCDACIHARPVTNLRIAIAHVARFVVELIRDLRSGDSWSVAIPPLSFPFSKISRLFGSQFFSGSSNPKNGVLLLHVCHPAGFLAVTRINAFTVASSFAGFFFLSIISARRCAGVLPAGP